ncbi:MAG: OmpA family protein [Gammaproteobacteria bacterium]
MVTHSMRARPLCALLLLLSAAVSATSVEDVTSLQIEAEAAQAALLSPQSYLRGSEALKRAQAKPPGESRQRDLAQAIEAFETVLANAATARARLGPPLAARDAANQAEAFRLAPADWARGEKVLAAAIGKLERGKVEAALARGADAEEIYRGAELVAIKARILSAARSALLEAEAGKAGKLAPRSLTLSRELLAQADSALEQSRYQTDEPSRLAAAARYQARLALMIAGHAQRVRAGDATIEDLILEWQQPLIRLAQTAGTRTDLADGFQATEAELKAELERLPRLENDLAERSRQVAGLEEEIRELDTRLGGANAERRDLVRQLEADARVREQFDVVQTLFTPQDADVLRDGDRLIVRLVGLRFASNSAQLNADAQALLQRLETAIEIFPRSEILVEGHTDSSGSPERNQSLSQERAQAVATYLMDSSGIQAFRVQVSGFGDSRPIATNRTGEGRAQNRRIDVVIVPQLRERG